MTDLNRRRLLAMLSSVPLVGELISEAEGQKPKPKAEEPKQKAKEKQAESKKLAAIEPPKWPITSIEPDDNNPAVRLVFQGLMVFCHKGNECHIAFSRNDMKHRFEIKIFENCRQKFVTTDDVDPIHFKNLSIGIDGEDSRVSFFHLNTFDRKRDQGHPKDFWWLLDFDDIYRKKLDKEKSFSKTRLTVRNGVFYTYQRTESTFNGEGGPFPSNPGEYLGHVAKIMAVDIPLALGQSVSLKINDNDVFHPLIFKPQTRYEVYFNNECWESDVKKCEDSDFDINFMVTKLSMPERFTLKVKDEKKDIAPEGLCITINKEYVDRGTDRAPCMGVGFGQGGGLPT